MKNNDRFFYANQTWYFIQIVFEENNLNQMGTPIICAEKKEPYFNICIVSWLNFQTAT